jgi:hypothetical protein
MRNDSFFPCFQFKDTVLGVDSISFVAVGAPPKIGALTMKASRPVDWETDASTEIRDREAGIDCSMDECFVRIKCCRLTQG